MFQPKFELHLKSENFDSKTAVCLGSQMISIIAFLENILPPHIWYGADLDAVGKMRRNDDLQSKIIRKIGLTSDLIKICSGIDQFLSGVFFAVRNTSANKKLNNIKESPSLVGGVLQAETEDKPFRSINMEGILIEIRAFDTTYFDIFSEDVETIRKLSSKFIL